MKTVWALSVDVPQSLADAVFAALPDNSLGQSAFKKEADDRSRDPLWVVQGLYAEEPDSAEFSLHLAVLSAVHSGTYVAKTGRIPATGWLKKNEQSYAPIRAGRVVIHSVKDAHLAAPHEKSIAMPIGAAFGTGEHPTTFGCLAALQLPGMLKRGMRVLDIGTGSGILAFAAAALKHARVLGVEMDAESVLAARENARSNGVRALVHVVKAEGFRHASMRGKKYPLILSNIFARPLAILAPTMRRHLKPGGHVVLAGFLQRDAQRVQSAYAAQRIHVKKRLIFGAWTILVLHRPCRTHTLLSPSRY